MHCIAKKWCIALLKNGALYCSQLLLLTDGVLLTVVALVRALLTVVIAHRRCIAHICCSQMVHRSQLLLTNGAFLTVVALVRACVNVENQPTKHSCVSLDIALANHLSG